MVVNKFWVLLLGVKIKKLGIGLEKNACWWKEEKIYRGSYYKEEWLEDFLDSKGAIYNGNESDNDVESYNESNEQHQLPVLTDNDSCKQTLSPFTACKNQKAWNRAREKCMLVKRTENFQGIILQRGMVRRFFKQQRCNLQW